MTEVQENIAVSKGQEENVIDRFIAEGGCFDQAFKDVFGLPESVQQSLKEVT
ncbi:hypothetical protein IAQ69_07015 [Acinetobacter variabilis]|uniref:Uncharacterized protein n=1 Tax=Acinetobacter variabilis TaxID=70346 RepID=A0A7T8AQN9_9GAMM|nr:hypothetical protein [Acinetobacter variabilis]QQN89396.1 hypothetical protein IAQ69_07015 [Acinetobacter variabilis]